jgi:hypothetical protein
MTIGRETLAGSSSGINGIRKIAHIVTVFVIRSCRTPLGDWTVRPAAAGIVAAPSLTWFAVEQSTSIGRSPTLVNASAVLHWRWA